MEDTVEKYKFVKVTLASGEIKNLILRRLEILNLTAAMHNIQNGVTHTTLFYDESAEVGKEVSQVIRLDSIEFLEVDDTFYTLKELEARGFQSLRLCKEPGILKKWFYKIKWWLEDRRVAK